MYSIVDTTLSPSNGRRLGVSKGVNILSPLSFTRKWKHQEGEKNSHVVNEDVW